MNNQFNRKGEYTVEELKQESIDALKERGVELMDIAEIVLFLQESYQENLTIEKCIDTVEAALRKREVAYAVLTGIELDKAAENNLLSGPILDIIKNDYKLYGIDEIIPLSITNVYGTIALTNLGYLDKMKPGIIGKLDNKEDGSVNTFLDDIVAGLAAAGASRLAHECVVNL